MSKYFKGVIVGDFQIPFHDVDAIDVAQQIARDFKPDVLDFNGDIMDMDRLSKFPGVVNEKNMERKIDMQSEFARGFEVMSNFAEEVKPKTIHMKTGNHEGRLERMIASAKADVKELLEMPEIRDLVKVEKLLKIDTLGANVKFAKWPNGLWLHPTLPPDQNVWVEHGNTAASKAGYAVSNISDKRASSVIMGHVHRLSVAWRHFNGDRDRFMIECGHLSILGTREDGDDMYYGSPFSVADYMDYQQGFALVTFADGKVWPELVRIKKGTALWNGKLYKSRIKKGKA
jgi:hypothetical protein